MAEHMADLFRRITTGVYVVGVAAGERRGAFTAAWVMQVSYVPLLLALAVHPEHASYELLAGGNVFSVNVLGLGQVDLARHFGTQSGRDVDKLAGVPWRRGATGAPILEEALAYFDCRVAERLRTGDHELFVGEVVDGRVAAAAAEPLAYATTGDLDGSGALYPRSFNATGEY